MPDFLLVAGSPSLAEHPQGRMWVSLLLHQVLNEAAPHAQIVSGGGVGPAAWAIEQAEAYGLHWVVYSRDGFRHTSPREGEGRRPPQRWAPSDASAEQHRRALIAAAVQARREGKSVLVLAFIAPWGPGDESEPLLALAEAEGLEYEPVLAGEPGQQRIEA